MTTESKKELTKSETDAVFLHLLEIHIADEAQLFFVDNNEYITSNGIDYAPVAFSISLPEDEKTSCALRIDDIDRLVTKSLLENRNKQITATVSVIVASRPDVIEMGPIELILRNIVISGSVITANLYDLYIFDRKIPEGSYTPQDFPGLF